MVLAEGPYGVITGRRRRRPRVLLIAGGVGITPMRVLFETIDLPGSDLTLIYRAPSEERLLLRAELDEIAATRDARLIYLVGPSTAPGISSPPGHWSGWSATSVITTSIFAPPPGCRPASGSRCFDPAIRGASCTRNTSPSERLGTTRVGRALYAVNCRAPFKARGATPLDPRQAPVRQDFRHATWKGAR